MGSIKSDVSLDQYDWLVAFARHLVEEEDWDSRQLLHFLEKPHKWGGEFAAWREAVARGEKFSLEVYHTSMAEEASGRLWS